MQIDIAGIQFPLTLDLQNAKLYGTIPNTLVTPLISRELDKYDNYSLKDTDFNRWTVINIDFGGLNNGGIAVKISINLKHREFLYSLFGKKHYTPWVSVTLHGEANFAASITNNVVNVDYRGHDIKGQKWYEEIVSLLANDLFKDKIAEAVKNSLKTFDGQNIASFLKQGNVSNLNIPIPIDQLLKNISVSASINPSGIDIDIKLPDTIQIT